MTRMTKVFNALLPPGRAGAMQAIAVKILRDSSAFLFDGLYDFLSSIHKDLGAIGDTETREDALVAWEDQFGLLPSPSDTLQQRRDSKEAAWALTGSCGPGYIQEALQRAGFDVYVRENIPAVNLSIGTQINFIAGNPPSGPDPEPQFGYDQFGEGLDGYILGNGRLLQTDGTTVDPFNTPAATSGGTNTVYASHGGASQKVHSTYGTSQFGAEATGWSYVFIIESESGDLAQIPIQRKAAFERELLRLKPAHLGVFVRVRYV